MTSEVNVYVQHHSNFDSSNFYKIYMNPNLYGYLGESPDTPKDRDALDEDQNWWHIVISSETMVGLPLG